VSESLHEQPITAAGLASPAQRVDDTSTPLPAAIPAVAGLPGGGYVVAWNDIPARNVYARRYAADGTPVSPPVRVNLSAGTTANVAVVALSDGRFVVSWIGASGTRIERTFPADGLTTP
jgi:large repetitive protein